MSVFPVLSSLTMASTLVIKVSYGDTLRRFNVAVRDDGQLSLDMEALRATILGLFNIPSESEIRLTYVDEDGDVVTLVDDYDLQEVMRQNLKFLKVSVILQHAKAGLSNSVPPSASSPFRSPPINGTLSNATSEAVSTGPPIKTGVANLLKSAPLREALSKLSMELASKNGSSSLVITDQKPFVATNVITQAGVGSVPTAPCLVPCVPEDGAVKCNGPSDTIQDERGPSLPNPISHPIDLTKDYENDSSPFRRMFGDSLRPLINKRAIGEADKQSKEQSAAIPVLTDTMQRWGTSCLRSNKLPNASSTHVLVPLDLTDAKSSNSQNDGLIGLFHQNIICDGCGIVPIPGPRYKSKIEEDHDLCSLCFADIVNKDDYIKMNAPMSAQHSQSSRSLRDPVQSNGLFSPGRSALLKLDSCFVLDVNVEDGTIMAPSTTFTKIWRMRNTGVVAWPCGTRLVQIGGDKFSTKDTADLEIPAHGVPVDAELDVAMDFTSPASPGQYISSWRMASPYGTPFGQGIWVHIQVDASPSSGRSHGFNLNLLPECGDEPKCLGTVDVKNKPVAGGVFPETYGSAISSEHFNLSHPAAPSGVCTSSDLPTVKPTKPDKKGKGVHDSAIEKMLLEDLEEMGFKQTNLNKEILRMNQYDLEQSLNDLCGVAEFDDSILLELDEMGGFCDKNLNKRLLIKNNGSIKRVVMDLLS